MERRQFILTTFKSLCATYLATQINGLPQSVEYAFGNQREKTLLAFIDAVVPDCDIHNLNNLTGFYDATLPMAKYLRILVFRINRLTRKLGYKKRFHLLTRDERADIIQFGYHHSKLDHELIHGAIYLSQITVYGGVFNQNSNADFIGFEGSASIEPDINIWHYSDMEGLESPMTANGNYK